MQEKEYQKFVCTLNDLARTMFNNPRRAMLCAAFVMLKARECGIVDVESPRSLLEDCGVDKLVGEFVEITIGKNWREFRSLITVAEEDDFRRFISEWRDDYRLSNATPPEVASIVLRLLEVNGKSESFADFGSGVGDVLIDVINMAKARSVNGFELSNEAIAVSKIRLDAMKCLKNANIKQANVFSLPKGERKFNKIFCYPPFGMRYQDEAMRAFLKSMPALSELRPSSSVSWLFALQAVESLKSCGKCAIIINDGPLFNQADLPFRKYLVDRNLVETIVSLPPFIFPQTSTASTVVILNASKKNSNIKMVDASGLGVRDKGLTKLQGEDIDTIVSCVTGRKTKARLAYALVENSVIAKEEFMLYPRRYVEVENLPTIRDGKKLGDVTEIKRGAAVTSSILKSLYTEDKTGFYYATQMNIKDGVIENKGIPIANISNEYLPYCAEDGDLILTKTGRPIKCAVVSMNKGEKLLVGANQYVLHLNTKVIDPYFLQAFFESGVGRAALGKISLGASLPSIALRDLKEMIIPVPPMAEQSIQKKVSVAYKAKLDEISLLRRKLARAIDDLDCVFAKSFAEEA